MPMVPTGSRLTLPLSNATAAAFNTTTTTTSTTTGNQARDCADRTQKRAVEASEKLNCPFRVTSEIISLFPPLATLHAWLHFASAPRSYALEDEEKFKLAELTESCEMKGEIN